MHIIRDSPLRDLGVILSQCAHVVVPDEEDSFKIDPEEELDIAGDDGVDSNETDDDYVPKGGSGTFGESDGEGVKYRTRGWVLFRGGQVNFIKRGWVKFRKRGWVKFIQKKGWVNFRKKGRVKSRKRG